MNQYETLKIDTAFHEYGSKRLKEYLERGWRIIDKSVTGDRYIYYVLRLCQDPDVGTCSK